MEISNKRLIFAAVTIDKKGATMLGINSPREPIKGEFATKVRMALWRSLTGNLTDEERKCEDKMKETSKEYTVTWE